MIEGKESDQAWEVALPVFLLQGLSPAGTEAKEEAVRGGLGHWANPGHHHLW